MTTNKSRERLVYAFLDANTFMHFTMFTAVKWPELLEANRVCLVLAPSVMRELEKYKDDSSQPARRNRVREVLSKLKPPLRVSRPDAPASIGPDVEIFDITQEPSINWQDRGLDPMTPDDRLIATILTFAPQLPGRTLLVTNDFPAERKATSHTIESWDPEGKLDRTRNESEVEKENRRLRQQLVQHQGGWSGMW